MSHRHTVAAAVAAAAFISPVAATARVADAPAVSPIAAHAAKARIIMSGSTSIYPLAIQLARAYAPSHDTAFTIVQGGTDIGIKDVSVGASTIGMASRDPLGSDPGGLVFNKIARDGICVITNNANPISGLSQETIQQVFSGRVRNWSDVQGAKVGGAINIISRTAASGTADAFQSIFMGPDLRIAANAQTKQSNGLVRQTVSSNKQAIGFVSFDFTKGVHTVRYKDVACTLRDASSGSYPGVRNFWLVTRGKAAGAAKSFIAWSQNNAKAKKIIKTHWVPRH